jgi:Na+/H+ antiporter NhaC
MAVLGALAALVWVIVTDDGRAHAPEGAWTVEHPELVLGGVPVDIEVTLADPAAWPDTIPFTIMEEGADADLAYGELESRTVFGEPVAEHTIEDVRFEGWGDHEFTILFGDQVADRTVSVIPGWLSILPPLIAIALAIIFRQVILALLAGVWVGALFTSDFNPLLALLHTADKYGAEALADSDHASIIVFTLLLGGMIGVIGRSGGARGLADVVTKRATTSSRGQLGTWGLGLLIFFDDYANTVLVGTTMRSITDRLRVSREKLAFLVDATAAPVSSLAVISSWIGVEVGYIAEQYKSIRDLEGDPYIVFLQTIPYRFYPILMLFFGLLVVVMRRDFGPMLKAERRARDEGKVLRDGAKPASEFEEADPAMSKAKPRWMNAVIPVVALVATAIAGMAWTGQTSLEQEHERAVAALETARAAELDAVDAGDSDAQTLAQLHVANAELDVELAETSVRNIFGKANALTSLLWAAFVGGIVIILLTLFQRALSLSDTLDAWTSGIKSMVPACVILILAWSINSVCQELHTAEFVIGAVEGWLTPALLPAIVFIIAAVVSFATGTSWGTMAILFPLVVPLAHNLAPGEETIMLGAISSILAGAVWGDHCSPISDTTILSSLATSCDHIDHVRTQLPYALLVGFISIVFGELGTATGLYPGWLGLVLGAIALVGVVRYLGKPVPDHVPDSTGPPPDRAPAESVSE